MNIGTVLLALPLAVAAPLPNVPPPPMPKLPAPAPFLFVKVLPPLGTKVAWQPGLREMERFAEPKPVGLRPGYSYRLELSDLPDLPGVSLYPSIEVRGTLHPTVGMDVRLHPVPVVFTQADIERALRGGLVSKVLFLEDPDKADDIQTKPDEPLEYNTFSERAAIDEARGRGRIVLIARLGERGYRPDELATENVAGTVLFPDATVVPTPACPPRLAYGGIPLYDPILGPIVSHEECLHDGGDSKRPLGIDNAGRLYGLDPSDTSMEFTTPRGRKVTTSNRVCLCVPRFGAIRSELSPTGHALLHGPAGQFLYYGTARMGARLPPVPIGNAEHVVGVKSTIRASGTIGTIGIHELEGLWGKPLAVAQVNGARVVAQVRGVEDITAYPCQMPLVKWVEPRIPHVIGEEVTFFLRYHNGTTAPMTDVVVSDSLTARLEYLDGSAKSDRPATFTVGPNEAGSVVVRWAIDGRLMPGESGLLSFKARIR